MTRARRPIPQPALAPYHRAALVTCVPLRPPELAEMLGVTPAALEAAMTTPRSSELTRRLALLAEHAALMRRRLGPTASAWRVELMRPLHAFDELPAAHVLARGSMMDARQVLRRLAGIAGEAGRDI